MGLIKQADLEGRLSRSLTTEEQSVFPTINAAIQSELERYLSTSLEAVEASARYFDSGMQHMSIDLCTDVTSIQEVDDDLAVVQTLDSTDYQVEPVNKTLKTYIRFRNSGQPRGLNNVKVTAKFSLYGDSEARNIIIGVLLDMLAKKVSSESIKGEVTKESIEGYSVEFARYKDLDKLKNFNVLI